MGDCTFDWSNHSVCFFCLLWFVRNGCVHPDSGSQWSDRKSRNNDCCLFHIGRFDASLVDCSDICAVSSTHAHNVWILNSFFHISNCNGNARWISVSRKNICTTILDFRKCLNTVMFWKNAKKLFV